MGTTVAIADVREDLRQEIEQSSFVRYNIDSPEIRSAASVELQRFNALLKAAEEERVKIAKPLYDAQKATNEFFRRLCAPLLEAKDALSRAMLEWDREQERLRRESAAEAARIADEEKRRLEAEAKRLAEAGRLETAAVVSATAEMVAPAPVAAAPKYAGEAKRELWHAKIVDVKAFALAAVNGQLDAVLTIAFHEAVAQGCATVLNKRAVALHEALNVPGVVAKSREVLAARAER